VPLVEESVVGYPADGGFGAIFRALARRLPDVRLRAEVTRVDVVARTVTLADGATLPWRTLVSTLPLPELVARTPAAPDDVREAVAGLRAVALRVVGVVVEGPEASDVQRLYVADDRCVAHKVARNHTSSPSLRARPRHVIVGEVSTTPDKPLPPGDLAARFVRAAGRARRALRRPSASCARWTRRAARLPAADAGPRGARRRRPRVARAPRRPHGRPLRRVGLRQLRRLPPRRLSAARSPRPRGGSCARRSSSWCRASFGDARDLDALFAPRRRRRSRSSSSTVAPRVLRRHLEHEAAARGFRLVGDGDLLLPNAARNAGLAHVTTPWVVFLDNDVVVAPGWLDALLDAAVATGAEVGAPLYCVHRQLHTTVHMAAGLAHVAEVAAAAAWSSRTRRCTARRGGAPRGTPQAVRTGRVPHDARAHRRAPRPRPPDEAYLGATEAQPTLHGRRAAATRSSWRRRARHVRPHAARRRRPPYFLHRWSEAGTAAGLAHFQRRFGLADDDPYLVQQRTFLAWHRQVALRPLDRWLRPLGRKRARDVAARLVARKAARIEARRRARP
jgi:hypothetical protein